MTRRLTVIRGTPAPDTPTERVRRRVRAMERPSWMLQCHRCGGRELIEARTGVESGKRRSGIAVWLCVSCLTRGERVVVE